MSAMAAAGDRRGRRGGRERPTKLEPPASSAPCMNFRCGAGAQRSFASRSKAAGVREGAQQRAPLCRRSLPPRPVLRLASRVPPWAPTLCAAACRIGARRSPSLHQLASVGPGCPLHSRRRRSQRSAGCRLQASCCSWRSACKPRLRPCTGGHELQSACDGCMPRRLPHVCCHACSSALADRGRRGLAFGLCLRAVACQQLSREPPDCSMPTCKHKPSAGTRSAGRPLPCTDRRQAAHAASARLAPGPGWRPRVARKLLTLNSRHGAHLGLPGGAGRPLHPAADPFFAEKTTECCSVRSSGSALASGRWRRGANCCG